jgi:transcriptional regulator with XRE-family HTH domain
MVDAGYATLRKNRISEIETGKRKVSVGEAFAFADVLGVFFEDLVRTAEDLAYVEWWRLQPEVWLANATFLLGPLVDAHRNSDVETADLILEEIGKQVDHWRSQLAQDDAWRRYAPDLPTDQDWVDALQANDPERLQHLHDRRDRVTAAYRRAMAGE